MILWEFLWGLISITIDLSSALGAEDFTLYPLFELGLNLMEI
jgi:hypothetical protein